MSNRDIGAETLTGIKEIKNHKKGNLALKTQTLNEPSPPKVIRSKLNETFARSHERCQDEAKIDEKAEFMSYK